MTIINDLAAAGIECEEAVRYDELRDFLGDVATGQYPKAADAMFSALARIAIEYKAEYDDAFEKLAMKDEDIESLLVYFHDAQARAAKAEAERDHARDLVVALEQRNGEALRLLNDTPVDQKASPDIWWAIVKARRVLEGEEATP